MDSLDMMLLSFANTNSTYHCGYLLAYEVKFHEY
jgi:hypothetical protein